MGGMIGNLIASGERIRDNPSLKSDHGQTRLNEMDPPLCETASMSQNEFKTDELI
jgi:hypothetical protein